VTPSTAPTVTYITLSTLAAMLELLSSTEGKNVKKLKLTIRCPTIDYPTNASAARGNDAVSTKYLLHHPSSRRLILLIKNYTPDVLCILNPSTQVSNASTFTKLSEHLHLLSSITWKKGINVHKLSQASVNDQHNLRMSAK
jgi:hypothetical protein